MLADSVEASHLDSIFNQSLYLRLLTGPAGGRVSGNGSFPAGVSEIATGGYSPMLVTAAKWASAVSGSPTIKTLPNPANSPLQFTPSGASWDICGFAFTTNNSTITSSNLVASDCLVDINNNPQIYHVGDGTPYDITNQYPIVVRLGDPPANANPT